MMRHELEINSKEMRERERWAGVNARMEADLLAEAYRHLEMRQRTRQQAESLRARQKRKGVL